MEAILPDLDPADCQHYPEHGAVIPAIPWVSGGVGEATRRYRTGSVGGGRGRRERGSHEDEMRVWKWCSHFNGCRHTSIPDRSRVRLQYALRGSRPVRFFRATIQLDEVTTNAHGETTGQPFADAVPA